MDRIQTILRNGGDGSLYLEDRRTEALKVTRFRQRPDERSHRIYLDQDRSLNVIDYEYHIEICLKGRYDSLEARSVLLKFNLCPRKPLYCRTHDSINCRAEWTCLVSIVDSEGCLRYPQSLTLMYDGIESPKEDEESIQVVSADSLLRESEVLLPDDTLTIQVDMVLKQYYAGERCKHKHIVFGDLLDWSFEIQSSGGVIRYRRLRLDSPLGELLREESRYFERLCATNMVEKNTGFLEIPEEEEATFIKMVKILSHPHVQRQISFHLNATIEDILGVYRMSHLYEIESVLDTCRCWLGLICRSHSSCVTEDDVSGISELAETYDDPILGELVRVFARNEGETKTQSGVEQGPWTCERRTVGNNKEFFRFDQQPKIRKKEHGTEDVSALSHCYI